MLNCEGVISMIALPMDLEQQVIQFAQFEHTDPVSFLKRVIDDYSVKRATQTEESLYLIGVDASLAEEWLDDEDEANYRDL